MVRNRPLFLVMPLVSLLVATSLFASGQVWDFLGYTQVDGSREHVNIQIARRDHLFRTVQVRITGDAIFFDHIVVHFVNGAEQQVVVSGRISSEQKVYTIELPADDRVLENIELFYFKEPWEHPPTVTLYGLRSMPADEFRAPETN
jgi:hypothetical protein